MLTKECVNLCSPIFHLRGTCSFFRESPPILRAIFFFSAISIRHFSPVPFFGFFPPFHLNLNSLEKFFAPPLSFLDHTLCPCNQIRPLASRQKGLHYVSFSLLLLFFLSLRRPPEPSTFPIFVRLRLEVRNRTVDFFLSLPSLFFSAVQQTKRMTFLVLYLPGGRANRFEANFSFGQQTVGFEELLPFSFRPLECTSPCGFGNSNRRFPFSFPAPFPVPTSRFLSSFFPPWRSNSFHCDCRDFLIFRGHK